MEKVQFVYNNLRFSSEKILKSFRSKTYNKNNPDNKIAILEYFQNRENEKCKSFLNSLNDLDHFLLLVYIRRRNNYREEDSEFSYASILRLFFEEYDDETLLGIRMANFAFDYNMSDEIINTRKKYMYLFNQMCKELLGTECDTSEIKDILYDVNYAMGVSSDESIVKGNFSDSDMQTVLRKEFEGCIVRLLELDEENILNNKARVSLMINYMRAILLCMDDDDIQYIKNMLNSIVPIGISSFAIDLVKSFFDNLESDREKYIGKSKVLM